ncbi:MAG: carbon starvation protein [Massilia sp.]|nr:carbon starvation protein [Massilia sp.]
MAPAVKRTDSLPANLIATSLCVGAWDYFLYQGVIDPLGGINTLWPLFGIANQMLAGIALVLATCVLFKMKRGRYAWVTILPTIWLLVCTLTAGWQKIFASDVSVGFVAHARRFQAAIDRDIVLAPAKSMEEMRRIVFNDYVDASLAALFMLVVVAVLVYGWRTVMQARTSTSPSAHETPYALAPWAQAGSP